MANLVSEPDSKLVHPTGPKLDRFCFKLNSGVLLSNFPANPVGIFLIDSTTYADGGSFIFADQTFTINGSLASPGYNGQEIDMTSGSTLELAQRFYGAMISNPYISDNAVVSGPTLSGASYEIVVSFNDFIEFTAANWFDNTGLSPATLANSGSAGVLPIYDNTAKTVYQLFLEDNTWVTEKRGVLAQADETGSERDIVLDFVGELSGLLYLTLPATLADDYLDETIFRMVYLRYGSLTLDSECNALAGPTVQTDDYMVLGAATQDFDDWANYSFTGSVGGQSFLTRRPPSICSYSDQNEWITFLLSANQYTAIAGTQPPVYSYFAVYTNNIGQVHAEFLGLQNGAWRLPIGGSNLPSAVTSTAGTQWVEIEIRANETGLGGGGGGTVVFSDAYRVRLCSDNCESELKYVYFREDLGNLGCIRFEVVEEKEVSQDYGVFYRPFNCDDSLTDIKELRGNRSYGHFATRAITLEFKSHYTPEIGLWVRSFRSSPEHYIIDTSKGGVVNWRYLRLDPDSILEKKRGEKIVFQATFTYHLEINRSAV